MFIPDPFKIDVIRFLDSAAGKAWRIALEGRRPALPDANLPHSTKLSTYDQRAGYEKALTDMDQIARESPDNPEGPKLNPLLDPRD